MNCITSSVDHSHGLIEDVPFLAPGETKLATTKLKPHAKTVDNFDDNVC